MVPRDADNVYRSTRLAQLDEAQKTGANPLVPSATGQTATFSSCDEAYLALTRTSMRAANVPETPRLLDSAH